MKLDSHIDVVLKEHDTLRVFGLVLYTEQHPHIVKVLRDDDYWAQFDSISGNKFAIFSARPARGRYEMPASRSNMMAMMLPIWREPAENRVLLSTFQLPDTESLPLFVVFAKLQDQSILQTTIRLTDSSEAAAYERLKTVILMVSGAAAKIAEEYRHDVENVFKAFSMQIDGFKDREAILTAFEWLPFVNKVRQWLPKS